MASRTRSAGPNQDDLFNPEVELLLPARLAIDGKVLGTGVSVLGLSKARPQRSRSSRSGGKITASSSTSASCSLGYRDQQSVKKACICLPGRDLFARNPRHEVESYW